MSEQINHNNYTALLAIMESFCAAAPDMKVSEAWPLIQKVEADTRDLSSHVVAASLPVVPTDTTSVVDTAKWLHVSASSGAEVVRDYMRDGKKINAIKELRAITSQGLIQVKDVCEHYERHFMFS